MLLLGHATRVERSWADSRDRSIDISLADLDPMHADDGQDRSSALKRTHSDTTREHPHGPQYNAVAARGSSPATAALILGTSARMQRPLSVVAGGKS